MRIFRVKAFLFIKADNAFDAEQDAEAMLNGLKPGEGLTKAHIREGSAKVHQEQEEGGKS